MKKVLIPKTREQAQEIGKKLSYKEILLYWKAYKRSLSNERLHQAILKKAFQEQMLRETVEGYLGADGHISLTRNDIEALLKKEQQGTQN